MDQGYKVIVLSPALMVDSVFMGNLYQFSLPVLSFVNMYISVYIQDIM